LMELMLGIFIFTTAFLMILGVFPTSVQSIHQGRTTMLATHIGQQQMEATLAQGYAALLALANAGTSSSQTQSIVSVVNGNTEVLTFTYQVTVSKVGGSDDLLDVRSQVSWSEGLTTNSSGGKQFFRTVNLETMVANI